MFKRNGSTVHHVPFSLAKLYNFVCTCTVYYNHTAQDVILTSLAAISALLPFIRSVRITSVTRPLARPYWLFSRDLVVSCRH